MLDATTGKVVAQMPICAGSDATVFDPGTKFVFSSCGDGTITIGHEDSPSGLKVVQTLQTVRGARTMAIDTSTHRIYVVGQDFQPADPSAQAPAAGARFGRGGTPAVPDSFKALVFSTK
jgi:hypothetical protein